MTHICCFTNICLQSKTLQGYEVVKLAEFVQLPSLLVQNLVLLFFVVWFKNVNTGPLQLRRTINRFSYYHKHLGRIFYCQDFRSCYAYEFYNTKTLVSCYLLGAEQILISAYLDNLYMFSPYYAYFVKYSKYNLRWENIFNNN